MPEAYSDLFREIPLPPVSAHDGDREVDREDRGRHHRGVRRVGEVEQRPGTDLLLVVIQEAPVIGATARKKGRPAKSPPPGQNEMWRKSQTVIGAPLPARDIPGPFDTFQTDTVLGAPGHIIGNARQQEDTVGGIFPQPSYNFV